MMLMQKKSGHWPTLNTVIMVEEVLKNMPNSVMTIPELKKTLPRQVNHNTLMLILEYLEYSGKIVVGLKGITWSHNANSNLKEAIEKGMRL
jgi:hypothetical protein